MKWFLLFFLVAGYTLSGNMEILNKKAAIKGADTNILKNNIIIIGYSSNSLLTDTAIFLIDRKELENYFNNAGTVEEGDALQLLTESNSHYFISGKIVINDTVDFVIFPSGIAIVETKPLTFLKGNINIPDDTYKPVNSTIKVLSFKKTSLDPEILEVWQKNDEYG